MFSQKKENNMRSKLQDGEKIYIYFFILRIKEQNKSTQVILM